MTDLPILQQPSKVVLDAAASGKPANEPSVVSEFADDPDLKDLVAWFVEGLDDQLRAMKQAVDKGRIEEVRRLSHQLKGAGGSYGYNCLTEAAKVLETYAKTEDIEGVKLAMASLERLCQAIIRGYKPALAATGDTVAPDKSCS